MDNIPDKYIGKILDDRYELVELIGTGGMSVVYKSLCHKLNRYDAVKILKDDLNTDIESIERFQAESKAIAMLSHPNIVSVYDVGQSDGLEYIVMELIDGITLKQYMSKKGVLSWKEALHFSVQICKALSHAHDRGIIHRDIKPQNIMILKDGSIKVADFGIAELQSDLSDSSDQAVGSVHYMAPEQAKGAVADSRSDIYSLGVVMYEMLTGTLPYTGSTAEEIAMKHISGKPDNPTDIVSDVPKMLEKIVLKAMSCDLQTRYQSAEEMLNDLEHFRTKQSVAEVRSKDRFSYRDVERDEKRNKAKKVTVMTGVLGVILFIGLLFLVLWNYWLKGIFTEAQKIEIPSFIGYQCDEVMNDSQYKGMYNFTVKLEMDQEHEYGYILDQTPSAGKNMSLVSEGINVELRVSSGYSEISVPEIKPGVYTEKEATDILKEAGFLVEVEETPSETVKEGYVISTSPTSDETLNVGSTVYILVSTGPEVKKVSMPNLIGRTVTDAEAKLLLSNLELGSVSYVEKEYDDNTMYGLVIWQSVSANSEIDEGTKIYIQVSKKPEG